VRSQIASESGCLAPADPRRAASTLAAKSGGGRVGAAASRATDLPPPGRAGPGAGTAGPGSGRRPGPRPRPRRPPRRRRPGVGGRHGLRTASGPGGGGRCRRTRAPAPRPRGRATRAARRGLVRRASPHHRGGRGRGAGPGPGILPQREGPLLHPPPSRGRVENSVRTAGDLQNSGTGRCGNPRPLRPCPTRASSDPGHRPAPQRSWDLPLERRHDRPVDLRGREPVLGGTRCVAAGAVGGADLRGDRAPPLARPLVHHHVAAALAAAEEARTAGTSTPGPPPACRQAGRRCAEGTSAGSRPVAARG
jgi:hypothetical protein